MFACLENKPETFLPSKQHALNQGTSMITLLKAKRTLKEIPQRFCKDEQNVDTGRI
jgi:hypothetical protein